MATDKFFVWGKGGAQLTPDQIAKQREIEDALLAKGIDTSPVGSAWEGLARVANAAAGSFRRGSLDKAEADTKAYDDGKFSSIIGLLNGGGGSSAFPAAPAATDGAFPPAPGAQAVAAPEGLRDGIVQTASALGIDPVDLGTAISYETAGTFDPTKTGPTTQWGQHRGLIQFGEPQAQKYGVNWEDPIGSQLGPNGAVANYLRDAGVKPGMGMLDVYSAINAGRVGRYGASDANNGGAPGTVADKVNSQMADHRAKALALLGDAPAAASPFDAQPGLAASASPALGYAGPQQPAAPPLPAPVEVAQAPAMAASDAAPAANWLPAEFQNSPQLQGADPTVGILSALTGQPGAAAPQRAASGITAPNGAAIPPEILQVLSDPRVSDRTRGIAQILLKQTMDRQSAMQEIQFKQADPAYQVGLEKSRIELEQLKDPRTKWQKLDDDTLFDPISGQTKDIGAPAGKPTGFRFDGKSIEGQALNGLIDSGELTVQQAQQMAAGKTITGPNGETIFMTPQGIFRNPAGGQASGGIDIFGAGQPPAAAPAAQAAGGMIPITEPKVTLDEKKAMTFADRLSTSGALIDNLEQAGLSSKDNAIKDNGWIPDILENQMVSGDFQKYDQARRDFINAQLRRESGAVISPEEFDNANKQYFPQPGDGPEVLQQKRDNRNVAIKGMVRDGGPTYKPPEIQTDEGWTELAPGVRVRKVN